MILEARFEPEASAELEHAALWYEHQRAGLGFEFLNAVDNCLAVVRRWPRAAAPVTDLPADLIVRAAPIARFPYRLIYLPANAAIRVVAIAHDARRPRYWTGRLSR